MAPPDTFPVSPRALAAAGISLDRLCERAGVAPATHWVTADFFKLWAAADRDIDDRAAGLRFGVDGVTRGYSVAAVVGLHAPDFRHALSAIARYKRLTCPELVEIDVRSDEVAVCYRWLQATGEVPRLLVDMTMASLRELARRGTAGQVAPIRLELTRRPADRELLRAHFGCDVRFGAPCDAMVFRRSALDVPLTTANGEAFSRLVDGLEKQMAQRDDAPALVGELRIAIARQLSEGRRVSVAEISRRLGLTSRTLQRRLAEQATRFQYELSAVRRTTASRLLANTDLDAVAISMLIGFAEPNSFSRAFHAWEKTTPAHWRERYLKDQSMIDAAVSS